MSEECDGFERFFSIDKTRQPQLSCVEVLDRVEADERRIIRAEYTEGLRQESIEMAILTEFRVRAERILGYDRFNKSTVTPKALTDLAASYDLELEFAEVKAGSMRDLGVAVSQHRVAMIANRECLDMTLTVRKSLRAALAKKYTEEIEKERSGATS